MLTGRVQSGPTVTRGHRRPDPRLESHADPLASGVGPCSPLSLHRLRALTAWYAEAPEQTLGEDTSGSCRAAGAAPRRRQGEGLLLGLSPWGPQSAGGDSAGRPRGVRGGDSCCGRAAGLNHPVTRDPPETPRGGFGDQVSDGNHS